MVITLKYGSKKDSFLKLLDRISKKSRTGIDTRKYAGKIKLKKDPLSYQKEIRNEWE